MHEIMQGKIPRGSIRIDSTYEPEGFQQSVVKAANLAREKSSLLQDLWEHLHIGFFQPDEESEVFAALTAPESGIYSPGIGDLIEMARLIEAKRARMIYDELTQEAERIRRENRPSHRER